MAGNRPIFILLLAIALLAVACGADDSNSVSTGGSGDDRVSSPGDSDPDDSEPGDEGPPTVSNDLVGTRWLVSHIVISGGEKQTQPPGEPATIEFDAGTISGLLGCNQYGVSWDSIAVDQLVISDDARSTEMACAGAQDWFDLTELLVQMTDWSIAGDTLILSDSLDNSIVATTGNGDGEADAQPGLVETDLTQQLIGLTEAAAGELADAAGRPWRVVSRDGEDFAVTLDYSEDRLNFTVVDDKVVNVEIG
ncbi:MAG: META domain-containing protein [Acidimicrobiales bacterium]